MKKVTAEQFSQFFEDLHGTAPFPWQCRLAHLVTAESGETSWPRQINLPTASGKTACIDVSLFALACAAATGFARLKAPRRVFFVVDRRIIVDQAFKRAAAIRDRLLSPDTEILKAVAENLCEIAREPHDTDPTPLKCFQLRGGVYRDDGWARSPIQPIVVCSTVDQLGSRLLFRGYGRSCKVWPVFAGLAANDSLILLDEAHCSAPFAETIESVRRYCGAEWAEQPLDAPVSVSVMSATLRYDQQSPFSLEAADYADEQLGPRLLCDKFARLAPEVKAKTGTRAFAEALVKEALLLADQGAKRIAVMVNRVQTAKHVFALLKDVPRERKELFIGRMRPLDSKCIADKWESRLQSNRTRPLLSEPVFIVATQCLEVGADFDFDGLVCECASLDALRQRFGRLNRLGLEKCCATILVSAEDAKAKTADPIYGTALAATWQWLKDRAQADEGEPRVNMGVQAVARLLSSLSSEELDPLIPVQRHAPVLLPSHVDRWVQTSPVPEPDPDVSLFLHGTQESAAEVQVCWRADLSVGAADFSELDSDHRSQLAELWAATLALCPPAAAECLPVPLWLARRWLAGEKIEKELLADVDGLGNDDDISSEPEGQVIPALRWRGPDAEETNFVRARDIRPGDTVVVPCAYGGWSKLGHIPSLDPDDPPTDLGDEANYAARGRPVLRIYSGAPRSWCINANLSDHDAFKMACAKLIDLSQANKFVEVFTDYEWRGDLSASLVQLSEVGGMPDWLRSAALTLARDTKNPATFYAHPSASQPENVEAMPGVILVGRRHMRSDADTFTGEDETSTCTTEVPLTQHLSGVSEFARGFAAGCRLSPMLQRSFELAGRLHDIGKLDMRFQSWLHSGNQAQAIVAIEPLAKSSGRDDRRARERARKAARYPRGGRHELLSLQLVETCGTDWVSDEIDSEIVLHLVASHHGHCRPFAPFVQDDDPPDVSWTNDGLKFELNSTQRKEWIPARLDSGIPNRFWRLVRRYGWWGLAWLESIFVLADWRESEVEIERDAGEPAGGIPEEASV